MRERVCKREREYVYICVCERKKDRMIDTSKISRGQNEQKKKR